MEEAQPLFHGGQLTVLTPKRAKKSVFYSISLTSMYISLLYKLALYKWISIGPKRCTRHINHTI